MNARSSRSHTIFKIIIESRDVEEEGAVLVSSINLVDLAGSENVRNTHAQGARLTEVSFFLLAYITEYSTNLNANYEWLLYIYRLGGEHQQVAPHALARDARPRRQGGLRPVSRLKAHAAPSACARRQHPHRAHWLRHPRPPLPRAVRLDSPVRSLFFYFFNMDYY